MATSLILPSRSILQTSLTKPSVGLLEAEKQARRSVSLPRSRCSTVSGGKASAGTSETSSFGDGCFADCAGSPQDNRLVSDTVAHATRRATERASASTLAVVGIVSTFPPVSHFSRAGGGRRRVEEEG